MEPYNELVAWLRHKYFDKERDGWPPSEYQHRNIVIQIMTWKYQCEYYGFRIKIEEETHRAIFSNRIETSRKQITDCHVLHDIVGILDFYFRHPFSIKLYSYWISVAMRCLYFFRKIYYVILCCIIHSFISFYHPLHYTNTKLHSLATWETTLTYKR